LLLRTGYGARDSGSCDLVYAEAEAEAAPVTKEQQEFQSVWCSEVWDKERTGRDVL